jgi:hypothetical protein
VFHARRRRRTHLQHLAPLRGEAKVVDQLLTAIERLNYPAEKLDVIIAAEADDHDTRAAITAQETQLSVSADTRTANATANTKQQEAPMVLLASEYHKSKYLKATDLECEKKFRIKKVTEQELGVGKDKEQKLVVWFTNDERGLVLNVTNNRTIRGAYGDPTEGWVGKIVVIFPAMVDVRGKMGPALRVRIPPPKQAAAATPSKPALPSGNGAAAPPPPAAVSPPAAPVDPELEPDPVKPIREEMDDEIPW